MFTLAVTYVDENSKTRDSAFNIGLVLSAAAIGAAVGFIVGGQTLNIFVDIDKVDSSSVPLKQSDPQWVGAWWIGIVAGICLFFLIAFPFLSYPKRLPHFDEIQYEKKSEAHGNATQEMLLEGGIITSIKEIAKGILCVEGIFNNTRLQHSQQNHPMQKHRAVKHRKRRKRDKERHRTTQNIKHKGLHINQRDQWATGAELGRPSATEIAEGYILGPVVFGAILDSSCNVWQDTCGAKGNCWIYSEWSLRVKVMIWWICCKLIGGTALFIAYHVYKPPSGSNSNTKEHMEVKDNYSLSTDLGDQDQSNGHFTKL
ncbi:hypothetical protein FSP39_016276 [Pinctada imbricata]|uniref:Uncharacterized protein n=1 Tax=Pinctada imbricata TaxID=66713 RepID=A0AA88Y558_PINIB|nr:hypothetical protein FSP39_016276 [Pinctada imbricata]